MLGGSLTLPHPLAGLDGDGAGAFLALADFVDHGLTFGELLDLHAAQLGVVEKQVVTPGGDEPESLFGDDFLDGTFWHFCSPENTNLWPARLTAHAAARRPKVSVFRRAEMPE